MGGRELSSQAQVLSIFSPIVQITERVGMGTNITIRCSNMYQGATFLHKDGHSVPIQQQDPDGGGTATFTLVGVTPADNGTYRCSYHPKGFPFLSSPLGDSVALEVTPTPPMAESHGNLLVAVLRVCAAALIFFHMVTLLKTSNLAVGLQNYTCREPQFLIHEKPNLCYPKTSKSCTLNTSKQIKGTAKKPPLGIPI
uniref:Immunoglobulin-like beta-sandwich domain-containing protein n=1 Tax=Phasianus colchicus TaxID=9054 RepID=A0A669QHL4_PHACC